MVLGLESAEVRVSSVVRAITATLEALEELVERSALHVVTVL
jgi:hypothetical protein